MRDYKEYVKSVGIELEGAMPNKHNGKEISMSMLAEGLEHPKRLTGSGDGSIGGFDSGCFNLGIPSIGIPPNYLPDHYIKYEWKYWGTVKEVQKWLQIMYVKYNYIGNETCGFHIHLKLPNNEFYKLASTQRFWRDFKAAYENKYKGNSRFLDRMGNTYCQFTYSPAKLNEQYVTYGKCNDRYTAINLNSVKVHGTLEIRIMPHQTSYQEAQNTVAWTVRTVNQIYSNILKDKEQYLTESKEILGGGVPTSIKNTFNSSAIAILGGFALMVLMFGIIGLTNNALLQVPMSALNASVKTASAQATLAQPSASNSIPTLNSSRNTFTIPSNPSGFTITNQSQYVSNSSATPIGSFNFPYMDNNGYQGVGYYFTTDGSVGYITNYAQYQQQAQEGFLN